MAITVSPAPVTSTGSGASNCVDVKRINPVFQQRHAVAAARHQQARDIPSLSRKSAPAVSRSAVVDNCFANNCSTSSWFGVADVNEAKSDRFETRISQQRNLSREAASRTSEIMLVSATP